MSTEQEIVEKLKPIIQPYLDDISVEEIQSDSHLINDLGLDSFYVIDVVIDIENEFDIAIDNDSISTFETVQQVIDVINQKLAEK
ncbi:MAG: phosphopantetheine-binding protein [Balneolales bacterium]|nr:phosphopantetheine-binding protein [Balneolales bacterium]